jgi:hypothetical protein
MTSSTALIKETYGLEHFSSTDKRVDVHVLHCYEPDNWVYACLDSLKDEPINIHLCDGIKGKVGLARANAFRHGTAEYVAFVDSDDEVFPGAFNAALEVLDNNPGVVGTYCDVQLIGAEPGIGYIKDVWKPLNQLLHASEVHHLHVMRREAVDQCLDELEEWDGYEEYLLMGLITQFGTMHHIPELLYNFRQHNSYPRAGAIGGNPMFMKAVSRVAPILHKHIAAGTMQCAS